MTFQNVSLLNLPPGVVKEGTQYSVGKRWYDTNLMRWIENVLIPVGGWKSIFIVPGTTQIIRAMFTWRDHLKAPWIAVGTADKLFGVSVIDGEYLVYDITPLTLNWSPGFKIGFGGGTFGTGPFGLDDPGSIAVSPDNYWSFDNFGSLLVAVHSEDGRLFSWDPATPATVAIPVANAPADNSLVTVSEEEFCMVMGGKNNPRRVKWSSRRNLNDWAPTEINTAGGFDLKSNGQIIAAIKVQGGILTLCDADVHVIEYLGAPDYYGRRKIAEDTGVLSNKAVAAVPGGAVWMDNSNFWMFDGNIAKLQCDIRTHVFVNSYLGKPISVHMGVNELNQEIWAFFPSKNSSEPDRYAILSYGKQPYWANGMLPRTAWANPVWMSRPLAANGQTVYEHELGWLNDGVSRAGTVYAETGAIEIGEGENVMRVNRIWQDVAIPAGEPETYAPKPFPYTITFKLRQAPGAPERIKGPYTMNTDKGYTTVRFRARQAVLRVDQVIDDAWGMGKLRLGMRAGGRR